MEWEFLKSCPADLGQLFPTLGGPCWMTRRGGAGRDVLSVNRFFQSAISAVLLLVGCAPAKTGSITFCPLDDYFGHARADGEIVFMPEADAMQIGHSIYVYEIRATDAAEAIAYPMALALPKAGGFPSGTTEVVVGGNTFDVVALPGDTTWLVSSREWSDKPFTESEPFRSAVIFSSRYGVMAIHTAYQTSSGSVQSYAYVRCGDTSRAFDRL